MNKVNLPFKVKLAASSFKSKRADWFDFISALLTSSGGGLKIIEIFENDAERYQGTPRGTLSAYWADIYLNNGGNLASALQGTLPDDEISIIRVSQDAGGDALTAALTDLARTSRLAEKTKRESIATLLSGLIAVAIASFMLFVFPIVSTNAIKDSYSFLPLENWGANGKRYLAYAAFVSTAWPFIVAGAVAALFVVSWSIGNVTGGLREWLDGRIALYKVIRDLKGAAFLSTMATLTRRRKGLIFTLKQSLEIFAESATSPWLKWRINQILDRADSSGAIGVSAFDTGLISREMYFYLEDMQKAKGFADGFLETSRYVESTLIASIIKRLTVYRMLMLFAAIVVAIAMFAFQFAVINEMRGAMQSFLMSS